MLIDDEASNRDVLGILLERHCPQLAVVGTADAADSGYEAISTLQPDLVFLDIQMPGKSGFDLLRRFDQINFQVIFVTAYDHYAVQAFEFNALNYLLKPLDYEKLIQAVRQAALHIQLGRQRDFIHFVRSLDEQQQLLKSISLLHKGSVTVVEITDICYIEAETAGCVLITTHGERLPSGKSLSEYAQLLQPYPHFLRINEGILLNVQYVQTYSKGAICRVRVKHCMWEIEVSRRRKGDMLGLLKMLGG
jgi:two-component system LytT family response regulator